jgi:hypothetical protein
MASNIDIIATMLTADATLVGALGVDGYVGILRGGVWTRRLKRMSPGNTPHAFNGKSEAAQLIRPAAVLIDRGDVPHRQRPAIPSAYVQTIPIYLYAPATATGKEAIKDARYRIWELLDKYTFVTENGPVAFVEYQERLGILDSEEFPEAVYDTVRYRVTSRLANEV